MEINSTETNWFQIFHSYLSLVDEHKAAPLLCPDDGSRYVIGITYRDDDVDYIPALLCFNCGSRVTPGLRILDQVRAVVKEHYDF